MILVNITATDNRIKTLETHLMQCVTYRDTNRDPYSGPLTSPKEQTSSVQGCAGKRTASSRASKHCRNPRSVCCWAEIVHQGLLSQIKHPQGHPLSFALKL